MIHIYYGNGKGKSTAALGLGMRARGAGMSVSLVRFLKDSNSSELCVLPFEIFETPNRLPFHPSEKYKDWIDGAIEYIIACESDMIILDEFLDVIGDFVSVPSAKRILTSLCGREVVITGHRKTEEIFDFADYITFMDKIKHPYDKGISARKGIEF